MKTLAVILSSFLVGMIGTLAVTYEEAKVPCIYNFSDSWLWYMEQGELNDIDDTVAEKKFHDMILTVLEEQKGIYVSKYGQQYVVPSYCYVEDTGFLVKLWKREE
jgi:hypothetical protein